MIFISHSRKDQEIARELTARLQAAGYDVWTDSYILPGDNWASEIGKALEKADFFLVLVTANSSDSEWVTQEVQYALTRSEQAPMIPVFIGDDATAKVPWVLRKLKGVKIGGPGDLGQVVDAVNQTHAAAR